MNIDETKMREVLSSEIRLDGVGEDPVITAVMSEEKFVNGSNLEAFEIANALRELLGGQKLMGEELARARQKMAEIDESTKKWEENSQKFMEELKAQGERLRMTDEQIEQLKAKSSIDLQAKIAEARAAIPIERKSFDEEIARMPKVKVVSPGKVITVTESGTLMAKLEPEEVRIKHRRWLLQPGKLTEVPAVVAEVLEARRRSEEETRQRQEAMQANLEQDELTTRLKEIDKKFQSSSAHVGDSIMGDVEMKKE